MADKPYEVGPIFSQGEGKSLGVRVTKGCNWNRCIFCPAYKGTDFEVRPLDDVLKDVDVAADYEGDRFESAFLQDADPLIAGTQHLLAVMDRVKQRFPSITRFLSYGRSHTLQRLGQDELAELAAAGYYKVARGVESGYDPLLRYIHKGATARIHIAAGQKVKEAGIVLSDCVMPGLGGDLELEVGKPTWLYHVRETARVINEVNPDILRLRTLIPVPGTILGERYRAGLFNRLSDPEIVREIRLLFESLDGITSNIDCNIVFNVLPELNGQMPEDKEKLLAGIDKYLAMSEEEQGAFRIGVVLSNRGGNIPPFFRLEQFKGTRKEKSLRIMRKLQRQGIKPEDYLMQVLT